MFPSLPSRAVDTLANFVDISSPKNDVCDSPGANESPENVHPLEHIEDIREDVGGEYLKHPYDSHADEDLEVLEEPLCAVVVSLLFNFKHKMYIII